MKEFKTILACCDTLFPQIENIHLYFDKGGVPLLISTNSMDNNTSSSNTTSSSNNDSSNKTFIFHALIATCDITELENNEMIESQGAEFELSQNNSQPPPPPPLVPKEKPNNKQKKNTKNIVTSDSETETESNSENEVLTLPKKRKSVFEMESGDE